jgi:hypothetical protein
VVGRLWGAFARRTQRRETRTAGGLGAGRVAPEPGLES